VEKIILGVRATSSQAGEAHPTPIELVYSWWHTAASSDATKVLATSGNGCILLLRLCERRRHHCLAANDTFASVFIIVFAIFFFLLPPPLFVAWLSGWICRRPRRSFGGRHLLLPPHLLAAKNQVTKKESLRTFQRS
jgi:hypothetical protein